MSSARVRTRLHHALATALAWLVIALSGCTGTFEDVPPALLVVGFDDGVTPQVGLVEDTFRSSDATPRDLVFVTGSELSLPEPAVAIDVVNRSGTRPTAVVLARGSGQEPATYLRGFSIQGIDPSAPSAFSFDPAYNVTLANDGPTNDAGVLDDLLEDAYCLVDAQISRTGRYLAVFEDRSVCGSAQNFLAMYVIEFPPGGGSPNVSRRFDQGEVGPGGIYVDQDGQLDPEGRAAVYFVEPTAGLRRYVFGASAPEDVALQGATIGQSPIVDIGRIGNSLILVESSSYVIVDTASAEPTATRVDSASGLSRIVVDPFGVTRSAVLLAGDALVVHESAIAEEFERESGAQPRSDATVESIDQFVYLLGNARIDVFDLLTFSGEQIQTTTFALPGIPNASVLTWTRAAVGAAP